MELLHHGEVQDVWELNLGIRTFEVQTNFVPGDDGEFKVLANGVPETIAAVALTTAICLAVTKAAGFCGAGRAGKERVS